MAGRTAWVFAVAFAAVLVLVLVAGVITLRWPKERPSKLGADYEKLASTIDGLTGMALAPVGAGGPPVTLGDWQRGAAWSTIKVPLVIAALRDDPARVTDEMVGAITRSDNAAANAIWQGLGDPATAAAKVQAVLAETGDHTTIQTERVRRQYSAYGQTDWSLTDQSRFLATAACDGRNEHVLSLMGQIVPDQRWGLGVVVGARFKGGWGPSPTGEYLVRQIGVIATPAGLTAVAMAAEPRSGSFADGQAAMTAMARWLTAHAAELPAGHCQASR